MTEPVPRRDPFGLAYRTMKAALMDARVRPGEQIKIAEFANELRLSVTPVREALYRLVGEELVEDRRRLGYFVPYLHGRALAELYGLQHLYLAAAADEAAPVAADDVATFFAQILRASGNRSLMEAAQRLADRLRPYAAAEQRLIDTTAEAAGLLGEANDGLRRRLADYFGTRIRLADAIAAEADARYR